MSRRSSIETASPRPDIWNLGDGSDSQYGPVPRFPSSGLLFEQDLKASRVYRRAKRHSLDISIRSSVARTHAWSIFSGLSLGQISSISVLALPLYPTDISNPEHYALKENLPQSAEGLASESVQDVQRAANKALSSEEMMSRHKSLISRLDLADRSTVTQLGHLILYDYVYVLDGAYSMGGAPRNARYVSSFTKQLVVQGLILTVTKDANVHVSTRLVIGTNTERQPT